MKSGLWREFWIYSTSTNPQGELSETNSLMQESPTLITSPNLTTPSRSLQSWYTNGSHIHIYFHHSCSCKGDFPASPNIHVLKTIPMLHGPTQMRSVLKETPTMIPHNPKTLRTDHTPPQWSQWIQFKKMDKSSFLIQPSCVHFWYSSKGSKSIEQQVEKLMEADNSVLLLAQKT